MIGLLKLLSGEIITAHTEPTSKIDLREQFKQNLKKDLIHSRIQMKAQPTDVHYSSLCYILSSSLSLATYVSLKYSEFHNGFQMVSWSIWKRPQGCKICSTWTSWVSRWPYNTMQISVQSLLIPIHWQESFEISAMCSVLIEIYLIF